MGDLAADQAGVGRPALLPPALLGVGLLLLLVVDGGPVGRDEEQAGGEEAPAQLGVLAAPAAEVGGEAPGLQEGVAGHRAVPGEQGAEGLVAVAQLRGAPVEGAPPVLGGEGLVGRVVALHQAADVDGAVGDLLGRVVGGVHVLARPHHHQVVGPVVPGHVPGHQFRVGEAVGVHEQHDVGPGAGGAQGAGPPGAVAVVLLAHQVEAQAGGGLGEHRGEVLLRAVVGHHHRDQVRPGSRAAPPGRPGCGAATAPGCRRG